MGKPGAPPDWPALLALPLPFFFFFLGALAFPACGMASLPPLPTVVKPAASVGAAVLKDLALEDEADVDGSAKGEGLKPPRTGQLGERALCRPPQSKQGYRQLH